MNSIVYGDSSMAFKKILWSYCKPPINALDVTYGNGKAWERIVDNTLDGEVRITSIDEDPNSKAAIHANFVTVRASDLSLAPFNLAFYDPPWGTANTLAERRLDYLHNNEFQMSALQKVSSYEDICYELDRLNIGLPNLLTRNSTLIVKISDTRIAGKLTLLHVEAINRLTGFYLFDYVLGVTNRKQALRLPYALVNHIFYLIFRLKPE